MPYHEINLAIFHHITQLGGPGQFPMIVHALDVTLLQDEVYEELNVARNQGMLPLNVPWLIGLFWVRRFYEEGNGLDYNIALGNQRNIEQIKEGIQGVWNLGDLLSRDVLIRQCPILLTANAGDQSQLTRGIKFLTSGLYEGFTEEEFQTRAEELIQRQSNPRYAEAQIQSILQYPKVFSELIGSLLTGEGVGWLGKIANHPLFGQVTLPKWGVYKNGPVACIALRLQTRLAAVVFSQDGVKSITREVHNGELIVPLDDFLSNGFEAGTNIQTLGGVEINLPDLHSIHLARVSRKRRFHPFVELTDEDGAVAEIQAAQLFAVMPNAANNAFRLGRIIVQATLLPLRNSPGHQLAHLDFSAIDRGQPLELRPPARLNGNVLLRVGAAPSLSLANSAELFEVHGDRDTWIVFGEKAQIRLHDFHGIDAQVLWPVTVVPDPQGLQATLACPLEDLGTKKHVTLQIPGRNYAISLSILFLPPKLRHAMISETVAECGSISWQPEVRPDTIRLRVEHTGLCPGILRVGQQNLQFSFPSNKFHFWNFRGVAAENTMDQPGTYDTIDEMNSLRSVLYVPDGDHELSWNGNVVQSLQGPGCYEVLFRELVQGENATRCTAERKLEMIGLQGTRSPILVCRAYPEVRRGDGAWDLVVPDGFDLQNHQVAFVAEGAIGVRVLMVKSCAELQWQEAEGVTIHRLDPINLHPDQGMFLLLWQGAQHLADLVMEPNRPPGVYGPFPLQHQNRFLSWDSFVAGVGDDIQAEVCLPGWLSAGWTDRNRHAILNSGAPASPLGQNHTPQIVAAFLDEMILSGIIWFADSNWGGDGGSFSRRLHEVLAAIGPVGLLNTRLVALSQHCPLVGELVAVVQGRRPVLAWLDWPAFRLGADGQNLVPIGAAANHQYQINFEYGGGIEVRDMSRFRRSGFSWEYLPNQANVTGAGNVVIPVSFGCAIDAISGLFNTILKDGAQFLGPRLSDVLSDLRGRLRAHFGEARSMLFETAALCRIRSWLPANPPPPRESEIVRNFLGEAWQDNACRDALTRDLATIEWLLAWFREGSFVDQPVLHAPVAANQIQGIGAFLNNEVAAGRIWFAEPEWGGGNEQSVPLLDRLAELSGVLGDYGGQQWEQAVAPCPLLGEFAMIARGDFGNRMWIPRNRIVMQDNQSPMPHVANIQFSYGHRTKRDNHEGFREPLQWQFTGQAPTLPLHFQQDYPVGGNVAAYPQQINNLINQCFGEALQHCHNLIGNSGQQTDLAYFFQCLSSWFGRYLGNASGRPAIFRLAVLCRLRAWVTSGIADHFLNQGQLNVLVPVIQNIWANPQQRDLLINDLTAVEWSLAWLHQLQ